MLGERLKLVRDELGITQEEVASYLNVKRQTYSAYERNHSIPDAITLSKLAKFFSVTADYLLEHKGSSKYLSQDALIHSEFHNEKICRLAVQIKLVKDAIKSIINLVSGYEVSKINNIEDLEYVLKNAVNEVIDELNEKIRAKK